jgi:hypothetical protein
MWIDISDEQLAEFRARKWQLAPDANGRFYLISPDGASKLRAVDVPARGGLHLYIIHALRSSRFKIGISNNPPSRPLSYR